MSRTQDIALTWAKIAEEENADIFSPLNEPFLHIGYEKAFAWHKDILPKLRQAYHGLLAPRGLQAYHFEQDIGLLERMDTQFDLTGWDMVAFDVYGRNTRNLDEYRQYINAVIGKAAELKQKYGARGIIFGEIGAPNVTDNAFPHFDQVKVTAESWQILYEESYGAVDYLFFWDWHHVPVEERGELKIIPTGDRLKNTLTKTFSHVPQCASGAETPQSPNFETTRGKIIFSDDFLDLSKWRKDAGDWQVKNGILMA